MAAMSGDPEFSASPRISYATSVRAISLRSAPRINCQPRSLAVLSGPSTTRRVSFGRMSFARQQSGGAMACGGVGIHSHSSNASCYVVSACEWDGDNVVPRIPTSSVSARRPSRYSRTRNPTSHGAWISAFAHSAPGPTFGSQRSTFPHADSNYRCTVFGGFSAEAEAGNGKGVISGPMRQSAGASRQDSQHADESSLRKCRSRTPG